MTQLTLAKAQTIIAAALAHSRQKSFAPMAVAVLDARGVLKAFGAEEGTALRRADIAIGKAYGALSMGGRFPYFGQAGGGTAAFHCRGHPRGRRIADPRCRRSTDPR